MTNLFRRKKAPAASSSSTRPSQEPPQTITRWDDPRDFEEFTVISHPSRADMSSSDVPASTPPTEDAVTTITTTTTTSPRRPPRPRSPSSPTSLGHAPAPSPPPSRPSLLTLPAELIPHLASHLSYPDLLALRHTHPRFLHTALMASGRPLKLAWLLDRASQSPPLPIPRNTKLRLDSDAAFTRNPEVAAIMLARRRHAECDPAPRGCRVVPGDTCGGRKVAWQSAPLTRLPWWTPRTDARDAWQWNEGQRAPRKVRWQPEKAATRQGGGGAAATAAPSSSSTPGTSGDQATAAATAAPPGNSPSTSSGTTAETAAEADVYTVVRYAGESWADVALRTLGDLAAGLAWLARRIAAGSATYDGHQVWADARRGRYGALDLPRAVPWLGRRLVVTTLDMTLLELDDRLKLAVAFALGLCIGPTSPGLALSLLVAGWLCGYMMLVVHGVR